VRDLLAEHATLHVRGAEVDTAPDPSVDDFLECGESRSKLRFGHGADLAPPDTASVELAGWTE
jgi:hypothetical protein